MNHLLQIRVDGVLVAEAPLIIHDASKARTALLRLMENGWNHVDYGTIAAVLRATQPEVAAKEQTFVALRVEDYTATNERDFGITNAASVSKSPDPREAGSDEKAPA